MVLGTTVVLDVVVVVSSVVVVVLVSMVVVVGSSVVVVDGIKGCCVKAVAGTISHWFSTIHHNWTQAPPPFS